MPLVRVKVQPDTELPALDTNTPPVPYKFLQAVSDWALYGEVMRKEENLGHALALDGSIRGSDKLEYLVMTKECHEVASASFKQSLDNVMDKRAMPIPYAVVILRYYHQFCKAENVEES